MEIQTPMYTHSNNLSKCTDEVIHLRMSKSVIRGEFQKTSDQSFIAINQASGQRPFTSANPVYAPQHHQNGFLRTLHLCAICESALKHLGDHNVLEELWHPSISQKNYQVIFRIFVRAASSYMELKIHTNLALTQQKLTER